MGEGSTEQKFPEAAASELLGYVSNLIKWPLLCARKARSDRPGTPQKENNINGF